LETQWK